MALRTQQEYDEAPASKKQVRRITASGQVNNFNIPTEDGDGNPLTIRYVDYLGKITKMTIDSNTDTDTKTAAAQFTRRFEGSSDEIVDPKVTENTASLSTSSEVALTSATDACAAMGTLGSVAEEIKDPAKEAEEAQTEMLAAVAEAAGTCGEVVSEVTTVIADIDTLITEATDLIPQLEAAGETDLANQLNAAVIAAGNVTETCTNNLNEALGADAPDIGAAVNDAVAQSNAAIAEASATVSSMMEAVKSGGCNAVSNTLSSLPVAPPGELGGSITTKLKELRPEQTRYLNSEGTVVNFNIDKKKPFADIQYRGKLTRMHYADAAQMLERFGTLGAVGVPV